jgi:hypothetical protein
VFALQRNNIFFFFTLSKNYMRLFVSYQRAALVALALFAIFGVLSSCTTTVAADPALLTRSGGWKFDRFTIGPAPSNQTNVWTGMTVAFTGSGTSGSLTFTPTEAATTASGLTAGTKFTGTWSLNDTRTIITLGDTGLLSGSYGVTELSSTAFRVKSTIAGNDVEWRFAAN